MHETKYKSIVYLKNTINGFIFIIIFFITIYVIGKEIKNLNINK